MSLGRCSDREFRELVAEILGRCPPPARVRVRFRRVPAADLHGDDGEVSKKGSEFTILVARGLSYSSTLETAIHEYAHVFDWRPHHPFNRDHGPTWGVHYAQVYCTVKGCA